MLLWELLTAGLANGVVMLFFSGTGSYIAFVGNIKTRYCSAHFLCFFIKYSPRLPTNLELFIDI